MLLGAITRLNRFRSRKIFIATYIKIVIVAQRLAKRLCDQCKKEVKPSEDLIKIIEENLSKLDSNILDKYNIDFNNLVIYHPVGCNKCNNKGYIGRIGIFEVVIITDEMENAIYEGKPETELEKIITKSRLR